MAHVHSRKRTTFMEIQSKNADPFGEAISDYYNNGKEAFLETETDVTDAEKMSVSYLFRSYNHMPKLEKTALQLSFGKVLDIGCGAGSHALYLQNEQRLDVTALDLSAKAIEICQKRGLKKAFVFDITQFPLTEIRERFDTILLLMNGTGIFGTLDGFAKALPHLLALLTPNGQLLIDSSDIRYLFENNEDGSIWVPHHKNYYGELDFTVRYKKNSTIQFPWVYIDYQTLHRIASALDAKCEQIDTGEHFDYLAKISVKKPGEPG